MVMRTTGKWRPDVEALAGPGTPEYTEARNAFDLAYGRMATDNVCGQQLGRCSVSQVMPGMVPGQPLSSAAAQQRLPSLTPGTRLAHQILTNASQRYEGGATTPQLQPHRFASEGRHQFHFAANECFLPTKSLPLGCSPKLNRESTAVPER